MNVNATSNSRIEAAYLERTRESAALAVQARTLFPSGVTHDSRYLRPYGTYVERGEGSRKWDVDGNEYIDYIVGHGSLLLGHARPEVVDAVREAIGASSHLGASHAKEVRWAQIIADLIPSAERIRFTASGTEATHMALRLARAHTGKTKLARFRANFHGWHDHMTSGYQSHYDGSPTPGVLAGVAESVVLLPPGDLDAVRDAFEADADIAAVFIEPTGGTFGLVPVTREFVAGLRELATKHGVALVFDEVITGFRVSRGGAQVALGVIPDMTVMAKILAGGLPGGAVVGDKAYLDHLDSDASRASGHEKVDHPGTFNANPISAAAGIAALEIVSTTDACDRANETAARLKEGFNEVLAQQNVPWAAYGTYSGVHIFTNPKGRAVDPHAFDPFAIPYMEFKARDPEVARKLRLAMLVNGVDICPWPGAFVSATHTDEDVDQSVDALRESLRMLAREDGL